jgi:predicted transporter
MDWVPIVFIVFKVLVLGTGMFFAIKWHHDRGTSSNPTNIIKVALECACYLLVVAIVFALIYGLLNHLGLLPAGLDFY